MLIDRGKERGKTSITKISRKISRQIEKYRGNRGKYRVKSRNIEAIEENIEADREISRPNYRGR